MSRPALEVADIFRSRGPAWRRANAGHVSLGQLKVMSAIENCRTAGLGGHVARCADCAYTTIAYNSCRNRHCPKCQGAAAKEWLGARAADLLPAPDYHVVLPLPALVAAHHAGRLSFFGDHTHLADARSFAAYLTPLRSAEWVVYSKRPFGRPEAVLAYLSRYTHRVAISNSRLISLDERGVTFKWKDYRIEGRERYKQMTLATDEFIRRFLIHVLPKGLHRIRHYGLFAKGACAGNIARARELLAVAKPESRSAAAAVDPSKPACPCCGGRMVIIEVFARGAAPRHRSTAPATVIRIDTS